MKILLNPKDTKKVYNVSEATEILKNFGLSRNDKTTQRLIREGKLNGKPLGNNPHDRRAGIGISEKDLYDFVTGEIPAIGMLYKLLDEQKPKAESTSKSRATKKPGETAAVNGSGPQGA